MNPAGMVGCKPSGGNHTVDVRMKQHILSPRVQDAEEANLGSKMFGIPRNFQKRFSHSAEQQVVKFDLVLPDEGLQFVRQREHDMEIRRDRQKLPFTRSNPTLACLSLALWTVAITA